MERKRGGRRPLLGTAPLSPKGVQVGLYLLPPLLFLSKKYIFCRPPPLLALGCPASDKCIKKAGDNREGPKGISLKREGGILGSLFSTFFIKNIFFIKKSQEQSYDENHTLR